MRHWSKYANRAGRIAVICGLAGLAACGGDDGGGPGGGNDGPVYAMMVQVLTPDGEDRTVYAVLTDTLDIDSVALDQAREFPGVANFAAVGGKLLVSDGSVPRIDSYDITASLGWQPGTSISFTNYPLPGDGANIFAQWFLNDHTAYLPYEATSRIIWDPSSMTITRSLEDSAIPQAIGTLLLENAGNRTSLVPDGAVMQPFFYHDDLWFEFSPRSPIAVYDVTTHAEAAVLDAPCPGLAIATRDETGNTYFSTWDYSPGQALYGLAPRPCVARIKPDRTLDQAFTTDMTALTGGRMSVNFRYLSGGLGITEVLHHEEIDLDFTGPYDPDVEDAVWTGGHFRLWFVDVAQGTARQVAGIEPGSAGFQTVRIDGRTFLFVFYDDAARTIAYELGANGALTERFRSVGEVFKWIRVR